MSDKSWNLSNKCPKCSQASRDAVGISPLLYVTTAIAAAKVLSDETVPEIVRYAQLIISDVKRAEDDSA